ncbi:hypothetical protein ACIGH6_14190 [Brachybacterium paraconglomeratum]|uniref:hypothetical protein n=1 Tax=Brachybacterium paraconglomeratum TaxID=173362 RepID=UPI0037C6D823
METIVRVAGVERAFTSLSWDAECAGFLPESLAGAGVVQRSGKIRWAPQSPVALRDDTPWTRVAGWPPRRGDEVVIVDRVPGGEEWVRFTGRIDGTTGASGEATESTIVDRWDRFDREASTVPVLNRTPGVRTGFMESSGDQSTGLSPWSVPYEVMRRAGLGLLPSRKGLLAADFQGSAYPSDGGFESAAPGGVQRSTSSPSFRKHPDITLAEHWVDPAPSRSVSSLCLALRVTRGDSVFSSSPTEVSVMLGTATVRVWVYPSRVEVALGGSTVASVPVSWGSGDLASLALRWAGSTLVVHADGVRSTASTSQPCPGSAARVSARARRTAAFHVDLNVAASDWEDWVSRIVPLPYELTTAPWAGYLPAASMVVARTARAVLEDYAAATIHAIWLDEFGLLQVHSPIVLRASPVTRTFTTRTDIFSLAWAEDWGLARASVRVAYQAPAISKSEAWRVPVWTAGGSEQLSRGESVEIIMAPGSDEDWVEPDWDLYAATGEEYDPNYGARSFWSATKSGEGVQDGAWAVSNVDFSVERITSHVAKATATVSGSLPAGVQVHLRTPPESVPSALWVRWRNVATPLIRARALVQWMDASATESGGPDWAGMYTHEAGRFLSREGAEMLAPYLLGILSSAPPSLRGIDVAYDPRVQLGDMVRVSADAQGVMVRGVVSGIHVDVSPSGHDLRLDVQVIDSQATAVEYAQLEDAWSGSTYSAFEAAWSGQDYGDFEYNPLGE